MSITLPPATMTRPLHSLLDQWKTEGDGTPMRLLDGPAMHAWLDADEAPLPASLKQERRVRIMIDLADIAHGHKSAQLGERLLEKVTAAAERQIEVCILVLAHALDESAPASPLDELAREAAAPVFEALRRHPAHFSHASLSLGPTDDLASVHVLSSSTVMHFIRGSLESLAAGVHVLRAQPLCHGHEFLQAIADAAGVDVDTRAEVPASAVGELMALALAHRHEAQAWPAAVQLHTLPAPRIDWRQRAATAIQGTPLARHSPPPSLDKSANMHWCSAAQGSVRYLRGGRDGSSAPALLLINAFGQTDDVWHDLVQAIAPHATVLMLPDEVPDSPHAPASQDRLPSYTGEDSLRRFVGEVEVMLAAEGFTSCHVASWCAGAKYAIELARALPGAIASLSLLAPSFAGTGHATSGVDSAFESSLNTMCQLVNRMPHSAESMARSMVASISKNTTKPPPDPSGAPTGAAQFGLPDAACQPWLHRPFSSAPAMVMYSRQLAKFRAHEVAPTQGIAKLTAPVLLVTGDQDSTTCSKRARDLCTALCDAVHFEMRHSGHYFIHQNSALTARLLIDFIRDGAQVRAPHPRLRHVPHVTTGQADEEVIGEL